DTNWEAEPGTGGLAPASRRGVLERMRNHGVCGRHALGPRAHGVRVASARLKRGANRAPERSAAFCMHRPDGALSANRLRISARSTLSFRAVRCPDVDLPQEIYDLP